MRFIHAADLHLDTPFSGLARTASAEVADRMREASLEALDALVAHTIDYGADALFLAGDIYDGAERGVRAQVRLVKALRRLSAEGIATYIVHGNHDPLSGWGAIDEWPPLVTVFAADRPQVAPLVRNGRTLALVHGQSYATREVKENLAAQFRRQPSDVFQIGLLHANVGDQPGHASYAPCRLDDLVATGLDYWALGHVHRHLVLKEKPHVVYPGNLQGRHPGEAGPKGAVQVTTAGRDVTECKFVELDRVRIDVRSVDVAAMSDLPQLHDQLADTAKAALDAANGRPVMLRIILTGHGPIHDLVASRAHLDDLLTELREDGMADEPFVWWEGVIDATLPDRDRDALARRVGPSIATHVVRNVNRMQEDPAALAAMVELAQKFVPQPLRKFSPDGDSWSDLLTEAENLALDALGEAES